MGARETGICPIREELYSQCFDELIRQVTIICAERGLLLLRVRDEIRMTMGAYQSLYESSIAFGMRKALQAEQRRNEYSAKLRALTGDNKRLKNEVEDLEKRIADIERTEAERRDAEERKHKEDVEAHKKQNASKKDALEQMLQAPKKA